MVVEKEEEEEEQEQEEEEQEEEQEQEGHIGTCSLVAIPPRSCACFSTRIRIASSAMNIRVVPARHLAGSRCAVRIWSAPSRQRECVWEGWEGAEAPAGRGGSTQREGEEGQKHLDRRVAVVGGGVDDALVEGEQQLVEVGRDLLEGDAHREARAPDPHLGGGNSEQARPHMRPMSMSCGGGGTATAGAGAAMRLWQQGGAMCREGPCAELHMVGDDFHGGIRTVSMTPR